ncbi:hypothetical protein OS493_030625 [Desmophyllum pertusum]|uniref:Uncharacterized protein n=1 Tax=Desmophyllum pertusum TaxID=174260 RepID=A0A9W9ZKP2_9CNID|nr:hypothetical protein OS493_030625 [Desmophyllum pertusum]
MGAEKVLSLVTKDILESNDHTLFQVPEITCLHMGYGKKSDNKEGRMAISEKDAKTWFNILKLQSIPKQQDLDLHVPMEVTDVLPTASKTQGEERTDAMEVDSNTRRDNEGYIYNDTVQPCHSGFLIPLKGSQILHMSILIINAIKRREANGRKLTVLKQTIQWRVRSWRVNPQITGLLKIWLQLLKRKKVEEITRHHQAAGIKDPQSLVKTVKKSAWDIITQATQSKPEIQSKLQKTLDKYFTAEQLRVEYTLLKCDNSPVVLVPLPYVYTGKGDFLHIEDIGRKWESDRGEVLSREQFINSFVRKRDIQMDYFECMKDAKLRQGVDYAIIYPDKSAFELFLAETRHIDPNVLTSLKHVESQGRGMISPRHAVVKYNEGNLVVSFTYFQGTDRKFSGSTVQSYWSTPLQHFTIVFLYGSTFSKYDADCKLGSLYPVREAKEVVF